MGKVMDHAAYPKALKAKTLAELLFIAKDAKEAIEANPFGRNAGYYADEVCYVANELAARKKLAKAG